MVLPSDILSRPADESVRRIALSTLDDAADAALRLVPGHEQDALETLRDRLTRFVLYVRLLGQRFGIDGGLPLAHAEELVERTDGIAQLDEAIEFLHRYRHEEHAVATPHFDGCLHRLERERADAGRAVLPRVRSEVEAFRHEARAELREMRVPIDGRSSVPSFGTVLAGVLRRQAATLLDALECQGEGGDAYLADDIHHLAASVRDLSSPGNVASSGDDPSLEEMLEAILDRTSRARKGIIAGALLVSRPSDGATRALEASLDGSLREVAELAAPEAIAALRDAVERYAASLEGRESMEIEYKYLLSSFPPEVARAGAWMLAQGYLPGQRLRERLRKVERDGRTVYLRTVKLGSGVERLEVEEETTEEIFDAMWPLTEGARVHKKRYSVEDGALVWTIDHFVDRDLVLAEVEVPSRDVAPSPPAWLASYIVRDVTGDPAYVNLNLAR